MAPDRSSALTDLARAGFARLGDADSLLTELEALTGVSRERILEGSGRAADADEALTGIVRVARRDAAPVAAIAGRADGWTAMWAVLGASRGFADFYLRHPEELAYLSATDGLPGAQEMRDDLHGRPQYRGRLQRRGVADRSGESAASGRRRSARLSRPDEGVTCGRNGYEE